MPLGALQNEGDLRRWLLQQFPFLGQSPSAGNTPRTLRGIIDTSGSGSITAGAGFTITRNGVGDVTINFDSDFNRLPAVVANRTGSAGTARTTLIGLSSVKVLLFDTGFAASDGGFSFVAEETDA